MTSSLERQLTQTAINNKAMDIANEAVRRELLSDTAQSFFQRTLTDITGSSLIVLSATWNPFEIDMISADGLGVRLGATDPMVLQLLLDEDLYDRAHQIAINAFMDAITQHKDTAVDFFTMILGDLVVEEKPFYKAEK